MSAEKKALNLNGIFNLHASQHESVIYGCLSQNYVLVNLYNTGLNSANSSVTPVKFVDHNCIDHCNYWLTKKKKKKNRIHICYGYYTYTVYGQEQTYKTSKFSDKSCYGRNMPCFRNLKAF